MLKALLFCDAPIHIDMEESPPTPPGGGCQDSPFSWLHLKHPDIFVRGYTFPGTKVVMLTSERQRRLFLHVVLRLEIFNHLLSACQLNT